MSAPPPDPSILAIFFDGANTYAPLLLVVVAGLSAAGIWRYGARMARTNDARGVAADRAADDAAADRKVQMGQLAALERQGKALETQGAAILAILRRIEGTPRPGEAPGDAAARPERSPEQGAGERLG